MAKRRDITPEEHDAAKHKLDALLQTVDSKAFMTSVLDEELSALKSEDQAIAENLPETISIQDVDARKLQTSIAVATREQDSAHTTRDAARHADFATKTKARAGTTRKTSYQGGKGRIMEIRAIKSICADTAKVFFEKTRPRYALEMVQIKGKRRQTSTGCTWPRI